MVFVSQEPFLMYAREGQCPSLPHPRYPSSREKARTLSNRIIEKHGCDIRVGTNFGLKALLEKAELELEVALNALIT